MRNFYTIVMAIVLLFATIACNPTDEKKGSGSAPNGGGGQGATGEGTSGQNGEPIKLGFCLELTGNAATFGISAKKGAEIAIAEINEDGGVLGRQLKGTFDDNASLPAQAQSVASKLINQDHVDVVIGAVASSNSIAMAAIAQESKVPMVTPASTNPAVTIDEAGNALEYVFRTCFTDDFQGEGIVDFAVNGPIKATKACIFYDADNDYSVGIWQTVKAVAGSKGLEIVAEDSYLSTSEQDFRSRLSKFKQYEFDVLIVPGYYNQVALIANQARELGLIQPLLGGDGFDSEDLWKNAGENIEGSYYTNHYAADDMDPAVQGFITKFKQTYGGAIPDAMAILTYDCVFVVADAIRRAGSTEPASVAKALGETVDFKGAAGSITIDGLHNATKKLVVLEIGEGGSLSWVHTFDPSSVEEIDTIVTSKSDEKGENTVDGSLQSEKMFLLRDPDSDRTFLCSSLTAFQVVRDNFYGKADDSEVMALFESGEVFPVLNGTMVKVLEYSNLDTITACRVEVINGEKVGETGWTYSSNVEAEI